VSADIASRNGILGALALADYGRLLGKMEPVTLARGEVTYRAKQDIEYVYFPGDAVVAMVNTTQEGRTVEVGIVGREGMVGINVFLGGLATPDRAVVQLSGSALRMKSRDLRTELHLGGPLQRSLLRYTQVLVAVISQSIACSQHHSVVQRLARWLLTMYDYAQPHEFAMSHESTAAMLGARRSGVSIAAAGLRDGGLIGYRRGRVAVLDKRGLERKSCECYRLIRKQRDGLRTRARSAVIPP